MKFSSINYIFWIILSSVFFAISEYLSKKFAITPKVLTVVCIVIIDVLSVLAWLPAILQKNQLSSVGTMWSVTSLLVTILIGVVIFSEKLSTTTILGITFAFVAIILLSL